MALSTELSTISYAGNNSAVTPYVIPFPFLDVADIFVSIGADGTATELAPSAYSVTRLPDGSGGSVVTVDPVPLTSTVTVFRRLDLFQPTEYPPAGPFPAASFETALDRTVMQIQQLSEEIDRIPGQTPPGIEPPGGWLEAAPNTLSGQNADGDLVSLSRVEAIEFLDLEDPAGSAEAAALAAAQAQAAVASISVHAYPGLPDYAALRLESGIAGTSRTVVGVGGGRFYWDPGAIADDNGRFISAASGGTWVRVYDGDINALWYGADPTGVVDSYDALQAAIDTGKNVKIPAGSYLCSAALTMDAQGQKVSGDGLTSSIILFNGSDIQGILLGPHTNPNQPPAPGSIADEIQWAFIQDLRLRYVNATPSTKRGVELLPRGGSSNWNGEGCGFINVHVEGFSTGFYVEWASKFQIINCMAKSCLAYGWELVGSPNNCLHAETLSAADCPIGLRLEGSAGNTIGLGDFALNEVGILVEGGVVTFLGGELESYSETFLKATGSCDVLMLTPRFLSRKVPCHIYDRGHVRMVGATWAVSGTYQVTQAGDGTVGPFAHPTLYYDDEEELTVYLQDTTGDNLKTYTAPADFVHSGDGSYGVQTGAIEFLVPIPATTNIITTITQAMVWLRSGSATAVVLGGSRFRFANIDDFSSQRTGRIKMFTGEILTSGEFNITPVLSSVVQPDNVGMICIRHPEIDLKFIGIDLDGKPYEWSTTRPNMKAREITSAATVYSNGLEHFVRKNGGQFVLLNPNNLLYGATPANARQIVIRNTDAVGNLTIGRNSGATLMNGVAANTILGPNAACTVITTGDDDEWTVLLHAS